MVDKKGEDNPKLTYKVRKFIDAYLICLNATKAAIEAGYSKKTAGSIGSENLKKPEIAAEIERRFNETMSSGEVLHRLAEQARGDIGVFIDPATLTLDIKAAIERGDTRLIKKIKQTIVTRTVGTEEQQTEIFEFELYDAQKALALLGKYHKLFVDRKSIENPDGSKIVFTTGMNIDNI
jgi:phage terminase small subunit